MKLNGCIDKISIQKFWREVTGYLENNCLGELCDILEVIFTIANAVGYSDEDINDNRNSKNLINGTFKKMLFLEKVITKETNADHL